MPKTLTVSEVFEDVDAVETDDFSEAEDVSAPDEVVCRVCC